MMKGDLQSIIEEWADAVVNVTSEKAVELIQNAAKRENIDNKTVKKMLIEALEKRGLEERRIRELIPPEYKNQKMVREPRKVEKIAALTAANARQLPETIQQSDPDLDNLIKENIQKESTIADLKKQLEAAVKESVPGYIELPPMQARLDIKKFLGLMVETNRRWQVRPLYMLLKIENGEVVDMELEQKALEVRA